MNSHILCNEANAWPAVSFHFGVVLQTLQCCWQISSSRFGGLLARAVGCSHVVGTSNLLSLWARVIGHGHCCECCDHCQYKLHLLYQINYILSPLHENLKPVTTNKFQKVREYKHQPSFQRFTCFSITPRKVVLSSTIRIRWPASCVSSSSICSVSSSLMGKKSVIEQP